MNSSEVVWNKGDEVVSWKGSDVQLPDQALWVSDLFPYNLLGVVTLFDEDTPADQPNAFLIDGDKQTRALLVRENESLVRFLGCYAQEDIVVFNAVNDTEYLVDPKSLKVIDTRYYR